MAKSKKKSGNCSAADAKLQSIRHHKRFKERIEELCTLLAGPEYFKLLPPGAMESMYINRYPVLKAKAAPGSDIKKSKVIQFNKLMNTLMEEHFLPIDNGNKVPLSLYLAEGLILINFIYIFVEHYPTGNEKLKEGFVDFFPESESQLVIENVMDELMTDTCVLLSDFNGSIYKADSMNTACFELSTKKNDIFIHEFKPQHVSIMIEGNYHSTTRLGWITSDLEWIWPKVKPSVLGFPAGSLEMPLDIYIQSHAINKLQERIDISPGIMHSIAFLIFVQDTIPHHFANGKSLVEYRVSDEKVGYFVVTMNDAKLVIRTFLFLTNDGTPEGRKLHKLAAIERADKEYLMIDKLSTFNAYHFEKNEKMSELFQEAGCGSLLKLGHVQEFSLNNVKDKDPESIEQYLADASFFRKENL
ncbi:MAG: hypothetical protein WKF66_18430 [Pedobacter sp.]